ncbi:hypothetical protein K070079E91_46820 [Eisenbergiella porci]
MPQAAINHYYGDRNEKQNLQGIFNHIDRNVYSARLPKKQFRGGLLSESAG